MDTKKMVRSCASSVKRASSVMALLSSEQKNNILLSMARAISDEAEKIKVENARDVSYARSAGLSDSLIDRLILNDKRIKAMVKGLEEVSGLEDPVGETMEEHKRPGGLLIKKMRVPIGVIGMIYESRPNVTVDSSGLCLKSGNAVLLRGGKEAINSNRCLVDIMRRSAIPAGMPAGGIEFIDTVEREAVSEMIRLDQFIDVIIPRGGEGLIRFIRDNASVPVIAHGKGVCHTYVDKEADLDMAIRVSFNAKVQRPGVCNAMETLLVHKSVSKDFLPKMIKKFREAGVEIRGCEQTLKIDGSVVPAKDEDWSAEYLDLIIAIRIVDSIEEALAHINRYGSGHSDAIITDDRSVREKFLKEVDSSSVYSNASTRFTDGGEFGMGAEIGISTQKLHCRGPMGVKELTSYKYVIYGQGHIRE